MRRKTEKTGKPEKTEKIENAESVTGFSRQTEPGEPEKQENQAGPAEQPEPEEQSKPEKPEKSAELSEKGSEPAAATKTKKKKKRVSRRARYGVTAAASAVVVTVAVLLLNLLADVLENRFPLTLDLTSDGMYTLSEESVKLATGLTKNVQVVIFSGESAFSNPSTGYEVYDTLLSQFYNTIQQYRLRSNGKLTYRFIDLDNNPTLASRYEEYDVGSGSILFLCGDRSQTMTINDLYTQNVDYNTYTATYTSEVERMVAAKVNLVSTDVIKKAAVLTGHGEQDELIQSVTDVMENNGCEVTNLDITASAEPQEDTSIFVIVAPGEDYTPQEVAKLREWLDNGGKRERDLLVFTGYRSACTNLFSFLEDSYAIRVENAIVCETDAMNVYNRNPYYVYGDIAATDFTGDLGEKRVLTPFTRQLTLLGDTDKEKSSYTIPLVTYGESAKLQSLASMNGEEGAPTGEESLYLGTSYPLIGAAYTTSRVYNNNDGGYYTTDVLVFGSELFLYSGLLQTVSSAFNEDCFLNTFRGLTGLESVITVSSRDLHTETLDFGNSVTPVVLLILFVVVLPLLMIAAAIAVFLRRRHL